VKVKAIPLFEANVIHLGKPKQKTGTSSVIEKSMAGYRKKQLNSLTSSLIWRKSGVFLALLTHRQKTP
jgi:hypothetical protein